MCLVFNLKGFSAGLFAFYRDDDGKPLTTRYADGFPPFNERYFIFYTSWYSHRRMFSRSLFRMYFCPLKIQLDSIIKLRYFFYVQTLVCSFL